MSGLKSGVWVKFMSFAIICAFILSGLIISVNSAPQAPSTLPIIGETNPAYVPGTEWVKDGVVLDVGPVMETIQVVTPSVVKMADGTYAMWYQGLGTDGHQRIMKAISADGLAWTRCGVAIDYGESTAEVGVQHPYVMIDSSGLYHMWYTGYSGYKNTRILHATSSDAVTWTKLGPELSSGSSYDLDGLSNPRVYFDGTQWHLWYSGCLWNPLRDTVCHAHKANLNDAWIKDGIVLANDMEYDNPIAWGQYIVPTDNGYDMFYGGRSPAQYPGRICHAHSADGLIWTKTGIALDRTLPGESSCTDLPSVIYENGVWHMWYCGYDGSVWRIFHAHCGTPVQSSVDLSVSQDDISLSDPEPKSGTPVTITANVQGDLSVSSEWVKSGVVLDLGGWGEDQQVGGPCVLRLSNETYLMFYLGKENDGTTVNYRIFRAFSYDGLEWHKQGMVLNYGGAYAGNSVYHPYVWIAPDGMYHMWYCGQNYEGGNRARILHATSPDGFNFIYDGLEINYGDIIEPASVNTPFVLSDDDGFRLWYLGTTWSPLRNLINHAHKTNLTDQWVKDGTVLQNNGIYDNPSAQRPWILKNDDGYEMFYSGTDAAGITRILHATSDDGMEWVKDGIVIEPTLPLEGIHTRWCSLIVEDGTYRMWYTGTTTTNNRIFYAEKSPGDDAQDATCTVSFYTDSVSPENLIGSVPDVFIPADGQTPVSIEWAAVAGEHEIIVEITDVNPPDNNETNNIASVLITVEESGQVDLAVYGDDIVLPEQITAGELVTIDATIHNLGESTSTWEKQGVVLSPGISAQYPYVIKDDSVYKMWYVGFGATPDIYYATSTDLATWTNYGRVLTHPTGTNYAAAPSVIKEADGTYKMWYSCQNYLWKTEIYYATSADGISWTQLGKVLPIGPAGSFDSVYACQGYVFKDSGIYKMYYKAYDSGLVSRFGLATSPDGIVWTKQGAVMNVPPGYAAMECPFVLPNDDGSYDMWFSTGKILKANSQDGIVWGSASVELDVTPGALDSRYVYTPMVLKEAGDFYMFYSGDSGSTSYIFLAEMAATGLDATCTVSFYLDSADPANLIGSVGNTFVPAGGQTSVSIEWEAVAGEHEIVVVVSDVNPPDSDLSNNAAAVSVSVSDPEPTPAEFIVGKVKLSGIDQGITHTYYEWELQITVTNTGGSDIIDVIVKDVLPAELELLEFVASTGTVSTQEPGTRSALPSPEIYPVRSTHIFWTLETLAPGQSETLYLKVCTRVNPGGNQEFTSPGTYIINEGACAKGIDTLTGDELEVHSQAITVSISELTENPEIVIKPPVSKLPRTWFFMVMIFACVLPGFNRKKKLDR
ncbi:MAG: hypothetical protein KKH41_08440 [Candidatus Thermoplasmatota archaeon]|nr:hypothetical protein [Euryarchaeota archaeon]MBU4032320.1 hypothetical protein [Candidatus Thermoplasmatota archaeon]MBU4070931.1 hypothetical protein [Candidatus Thermoplasmatota archaeon]MBU4144317.1 hypothetical protein [Candidatus Thermoplasmatota archaeon]MBU4592593.1 hypothetical protein [Candidatus Thermoplasmatota archaeon]